MNTDLASDCFLICFPVAYLQLFKKIQLGCKGLGMRNGSVQPQNLPSQRFHRPPSKEFPYQGVAGNSVVIVENTSRPPPRDSTIALHGATRINELACNLFREAPNP